MTGPVLRFMVLYAFFVNDSIDPDGGDRGDSEWDVLMWMDHRARDEADHINRVAAGHRVLDFVGGKVL